VITKIRTFRNTNIIFSKRRRTKKNRIRQGGAFIIEDAHDIIAQDEINKRVQHDKRSRRINRNKGNSTTRCYNTYRKTGHNTRTCQEIIDISSSLESE
jgi:hypothetical protein